MINKFLKKNNPNRVIILGKTGFIASNLISLLKKNKIKFISLSSKDINLLSQSSSNKLNNIIKKNDSLVFISSIAPVKNYSMFLKNIIMCKNFLNLKVLNNISHFIYISSDAVYSDSKNLISEKSKTDPDSLHGIMHITREKLFKNYFKKNISILRPTLIYGETDPHNGYGPNKFIRDIKNKKQLSIFGNGEEKRDHVWIQDVVNIIYLCLIYRFIGTLNIVSGKIISFSKIANIIINYSKKNIKLNKIERTGPMPHNGYRAFDNKLLIKTFNYKFNDFKKVLKSIYKNYK